MSKSSTIVKKIFVSVFISFIVFLSISAGLIISQNLQHTSVLQANNTGGGLDFTAIKSSAKNPLPPLSHYSARDGAELDYHLYKSTIPTDKYFILLHGSGWHGQQFLDLANTIAKSGAANVLTPDLRGHGYSPQSRGDLAYIGQFEDDIHDLISVIKDKTVNTTLILGGHSSGGGLVVRFLGGPYGHTIDAAILLAPYLKYNAPTTRENSGGWARPLTRRIIGLSMLNSIGITAFNDLPVIQFNMPQKVLDGPLGHTATLNYTHRLNTSYAPRDDFEADLRAITQPFLLLAGEQDEAFYASKYEEVIAEQTKSGQYKIIPDLSHLEIAQSEKSSRLIIDWLEALKK